MNKKPNQKNHPNQQTARTGISENSRKDLLSWYQREKQDYPFRDQTLPNSSHPDPYSVWLSEIMLQQTRMEAVIDKYLRFIKSLPDLPALAQAPTDRVLQLWQGLGYYQRARNLRRAARQLVDRFPGKKLPRAGDPGYLNLFPQKAEDWRELPGIGPYTAAAIASIVFGEPLPVVDGNVNRIYSRLTCRPPVEKEVREFMRPLFEVKSSGPETGPGSPPPTRGNPPGDLNQALMDLGRLICLPRKPACEQCPLEPDCRARREERVDQYPPRPAKKEPLPVHLVFLALIRKKSKKDSGDHLLFKDHEQEVFLKGLASLPALSLVAPPQDRPRFRPGQYGFRPALWKFLAETWPGFADWEDALRSNPANIPQPGELWPPLPAATEFFPDCFGHSITHHKIRVSLLVLRPEGLAPARGRKFDKAFQNFLNREKAIYHWQPAIYLEKNMVSSLGKKLWRAWNAAAKNTS